MLRLLIAILVSMSVQSVTDATGTIRGVVLNGSRADEPLANAEVHLRAGVNGVFESVATTNTDSLGRFSFENVPLDPAIVYLPGANRDGVHYPGRRVRLDAASKVAEVRIMAYDAVRSVSPLAARRHDIEIEVGNRVVEVTETLLVANESHATYVGEKQGDDGLVTLRLSVPPNFDKVTFGSEFFGRRFRIVNHQVVTDMPWPPGERELKFTYRVPIEESGGQFHRPLDLPTTNLKIQTEGDKQVASNIAPAAVVKGRRTFAVNDRQLPTGYTIRLQIGDVPVPWMMIGRWASLAALVTLVLGTILVSRLRSGNSGKSTLPKSHKNHGAGARRRTKMKHHLARADRMNS
jgi:hypothetical protein